MGISLLMTSPTGLTPCVSDDICNSPTLSSASGVSIVSFDSIFSNPDVISPTALGAPLPQRATILGGSETPAGIQLATDDSFVRHDKYFFKDGNITFLVCVTPLPNIGLLHTQLIDDLSGRWHPLLRPSILFLSRFGPLLYQIRPAWCPRS
jgi:hypothetical protein